MDFFKDKIVFPEMLKLLLLSFAWLGNSGMCVLVGGGRAVNRKHHPAERCDLRFGFQITPLRRVMFALVLAGIFLNCVVFALKNMASVSNHKILGSSVTYSKDLSFQA